MIVLEEAISFAASVHKGQVDKVGEPYILHPIRVMLSLTHPIDRVVGILHDVIEDANVTCKDLADLGCDEIIIQALLSVSKLKDELWMDFIKRACENEIGQRVKRADISDNASPVRLFKLDPDTRNRLFKKYSQAIEYIDCHNHIKSIGG